MSAPEGLESEAPTQVVDEKQGDDNEAAGSPSTSEIVPARKFGPGDIRRVLVQNFAEIYQYNLEPDVPPEPADEDIEGGDGKGGEEEREGEKAEGLDSQDGDRIQPLEPLEKEAREMKEALDLEVGTIKHQMKEVFGQLHTLEGYLEEGFLTKLKREQEFSKSLEDQWGLIAGVDIPVPANISKSESGETYLCCESNGFGLESEETSGGGEGLRGRIVDLNAIMRANAKVRSEQQRKRVKSPPPGSRVRRSTLLPIDDDKNLSVRSSGGVKNSKSPPRKRGRASAKQEKIKKLLWRAPRKDQVAEEKKVLERMSRKLNYLKNPRFNSESTSLSLSLSRSSILASNMDPKNSQGTLSVFCEPRELLFDAYEPGGEYALKVRITNRTATSRRIKIVPCATPYFNTVQKSFPGKKVGMLAPGMHITVFVYFTPDSLRAYEDAFTVWTDHGSLSVPVRGSRPEPSLSLDSVIPCDVCLIGEQKVAEIEINNSGGHGRFWVIPDSGSPPVITNRPGPETDPNESLKLGNFTVEPRVFALAPGDKMNLRVTFQSDELREETERFHLLCDNHTSKLYTLRAKASDLSLELTAVDGSVDMNPEACSLESAIQRYNGDSSCSAPIALPFFLPSSTLAFSDATVGGSSSRKFQITNSCPLPVLFHWDLPGLERARKKSKAKSPERGPSVFSIRPKKGTMEPFQRLEFEAIFRPRDGTLQNQTARLIVDGLPKGLSHIEGAVDSSSGISLPILGFRLQGEGVAGTVSMKPAVLDFGADMLVGLEYKRTTTLSNASSSPKFIAFRSPKSLLPSSITPSLTNLSLSHRTLKINPRESVTITVTLRCDRMGKLEWDLPCGVHKGLPAQLRLRGEVKGPRIRCLTPWVDFGALNFGMKGISKTVPVMLENRLAIPANFTFMPPTVPDKEGKQADPNSLLSFSFSPQQGYIAPNSTTTVDATLHPQASGKFYSHLTIHTENGPTQYVPIQAMVEVPEIVMLPSAARDLGRCYVGIHRDITLSLRNRTFLEASFEWEDVVEDGFSIRFQPKKGILTPGEEQGIHAEIIPRLPGPLAILVGCDIEGMVDPLGLEIKGDVKPLMVSCHSLHIDDPYKSAGICHSDSGVTSEVLDKMYPFMSEAEASPIGETMGTLEEIDYGECEIFSENCVVIVLRNHSAIETTYSVGLEEKFVVEELPSSENFLIEKSRGKTGRIDGRHEAITHFRSQNGKSYFQSFKISERRNDILKQAKGIAFSVTPSSGALAPFSTVRIRVSCINNLCGIIQDILRVKIRGLKDRLVPLKLFVTGSPVSFPRDNPLIHYEGGQRGCLHWTDVAANTGRYSKTIMVENMGPVPIQIRWSLHNYRDVRENSIVLVTIKPVGCLHEGRETNPISLTVKPYSHPKVDSARPFFFNFQPMVQVLQPHARGKVSVTFDSEIAPEDGTQCAAFLQGTLYVRKKDAAMLSTSARILPLNQKRPQDPQEKQPTLVESKHLAKPQPEQIPHDTKMESVLDEIKAFEARLQGIAPLEPDSNSGFEPSIPSAPSPVPSLKAKRKVNEGNHENGSSWIPAPKPLDVKVLVLSLEARATPPTLAVDKKKRIDGSKRIKYIIGPYTENKGLTETPLVKHVPVINTTASVTKFTARVEPNNWFQICYISETPEQLTAEMKKPIEATLRENKLLREIHTLPKFSRRFKVPESAHGPTSLSPGEATHVGVRFKPYSPVDVKRWPLTRKVVCAGCLILTYDGGKKTQRVALEATLLRPSIELNHAFGTPSPLFTGLPLKLAFARVYVREKKDLVVEMRNPTDTCARWNIRHVPRARTTGVGTLKTSTLKNLNLTEFDLHDGIIDDPSVFTFTAYSGLINPKSRTPVTADATPLDDNIQSLVETLKTGKVSKDLRPIRMRRKGIEHVRIRVSFSPKEDIRYFSQFEVVVEQGYPRNVRIELRGEGTFEEAMRGR